MPFSEGKSSLAKVSLNNKRKYRLEILKGNITKVRLLNVSVLSKSNMLFTQLEWKQNTVTMVFQQIFVRKAIGQQQTRKRFKDSKGW